jgi:hypothetical protein
VEFLDLEDLSTALSIDDFLTTAISIEKFDPSLPLSVRVYTEEDGYGEQ